PIPGQPSVPPKVAPAPPHEEDVCSHSSTPGRPPRRRTPNHAPPSGSPPLHGLAHFRRTGLLTERPPKSGTGTAKNFQTCNTLRLEPVRHLDPVNHHNKKPIINSSTIAPPHNRATNQRDRLSNSEPELMAL